MLAFVPEGILPGTKAKASELLDFRPRSTPGSRRQVLQPTITLTGIDHHRSHTDRRGAGCRGQY